MHEAFPVARGSVESPYPPISNPACANRSLCTIFLSTSLTNLTQNQETIEDEKALADIYESVPINHKILMFENEKQINKYNNREEFIKEYQDLQSKIEERKKVLKTICDAECQRIIKEFDFRQYGQKYKTDSPTVLGCLFGAHYADKLIIRFGLMRR